MKTTTEMPRGAAGSYLKLLHDLKQQQANQNVSKTFNASAKIFTVDVI